MLHQIVEGTNTKRETRTKRSVKKKKKKKSKPVILINKDIFFQTSRLWSKMKVEAHGRIKEIVSGHADSNGGTRNLAKTPKDKLE